MEANSGKIDRKSATELYAALDSVKELRDIGMAWIEARVSIGDADNGSSKGIFAVSVVLLLAIFCMSLFPDCIVSVRQSA